MSAQILVVEDESDIRQLIADAMTECDYDIVMCNNALTARAELAKGTPDLAITIPSRALMPAPMITSLNPSHRASCCQEYKPY